MPTDILAAGGVVWRTIRGERRIGIVRRLRYGGDVSLPKGKLETGESLKECALREVAEELGVVAQLGAYAGLLNYRVGDREKYVLFWEMDYVGDTGEGPDGKEVGEHLWLTVEEAFAQLTHRSDRDLLASLTAAPRPSSPG